MCVWSSPVCSRCSPNPSHRCSCGQQHYITASLAQRSPEPRSQHTPLPNPTSPRSPSPIIPVCLSPRLSLDSEGKLMDALFLSHIKFQVTLFWILSRETINIYVHVITSSYVISSDAILNLMLWDWWALQSNLTAFKTVLCSFCPLKYFFFLSERHFFSLTMLLNSTILPSRKNK